MNNIKSEVKVSEIKKAVELLNTARNRNNGFIWFNQKKNKVEVITCE